jgi:hypothetical protein
VTTKATTTDDVWKDIPVDVQTRLMAKIEQCFADIDARVVWMREVAGMTTVEKNVELAHSLQEEIDTLIYQSPSSSPATILAREDMTDCLNRAETNEPKNANAVTVLQQEYIVRYVADTYRRVQKAIRVFQLLDVSSKGYLEDEDLYRALRDLSTTGATTDGPDPFLNEDTIGDMMGIAASSRDNDDCPDPNHITVTCDDIILMARLVNL